MEKILRNASSQGGPKQTILVRVTPEELRQIASELEELGKKCMPLEYVHYAVTPNLTFQYKPEVSRMNFIQVSEFAEVKQEIANRASHDTAEAFSIRTMNDNVKDIGNA